MTLRRLRWRWACWRYQHGGEWCRIQEWRIAAWYHRRAVYPWAMWQAFGEPEGFRPPSQGDLRRVPPSVFSAMA